MRVSFTDQWQVLFDGNGKPLIGRVKFMSADASQFKAVYYEDNNGNEVLAPNPCYTLQDGRLEHQIFLGYGAYTCIVERFIGTDVSNMTDYSDDPNYWTEIKRFKAFGGKAPSSSSTNLDSGFVDSIADLRLVDPSVHSIISVAGYYSKEDGIEPRTYVWEAESEDSEDYGSTIVSSLSGYTNSGVWKLCETPIVCATTFGVFPDRTSTITPSDLSTKATALANYAANSSIVNAVHFSRGAYLFAEGTRLNFTKKVIAGDSNYANKYLKMGMFVEDGQEPAGTVEIAFIGGLELTQEAYLCYNPDDDYVTFSFGAGTIRTSWLQTTSKHIDASVSYEGLEVILDRSTQNAFCGGNKTFKDWHFVGRERSAYNYVPDNVTFKECTFEGSCFRCRDDNTFIKCGTLFQANIGAGLTFIKDNVIWNDDGSIKSTGTMFVVNRVSLTKDYAGIIDNSCIKAIGDGAMIVRHSLNPVTFKLLDRDWILNGVMGFANSSKVFASRYSLFDHAVAYAIANGKKVDLEGNTYSYTIEVTAENDSVTYFFENGKLNLSKSGSAQNSPTIALQDVSFTAVNGISSLNFVARASYLTGFDHIDTITSVSVDLIDCDVYIESGKKLCLTESSCTNVNFNGQVGIFPTDGSLNQSFKNCEFTKPLIVNAVDTECTCNIKVVGCTFNIPNSSVKVAAIQPYQYNGGTFENESANGYVIADNTYIGDAYLLPVKEVEFKLTSSTDGSTPTQTETTGDVSSGMFYLFSLHTARNNFTARADKFMQYNFASEKLFHFGYIDSYILKAKPMSMAAFHYDNGRDGQIWPSKDYVIGNAYGGISEKMALYHVSADSSFNNEQAKDCLPTIEWWVEIRKV